MDKYLRVTLLLNVVIYWTFINELGTFLYLYPLIVFAFHIHN